MSVLINPYALTPPPVAATREYRALKSGGGSGSSVLSIASCDVGAAEPGRFVVVSLVVHLTTSRGLVSATIGGSAARINRYVRHESGTNYWVIAAILSAPLDAGATATIALTFDGSVNSGNSIAYAATYKTTGLESNVEIDNDALTTNTSTASKNLQVDVQEGGLVFDCAAAEVTSPPVTYSYTGATKDFQTVVGTGFSAVGGSLEVTADETARTITLTGTKSWRDARVAVSLR